MSCFCNGINGPIQVDITGQPISVTGTFSALSEPSSPLALGSVTNVPDNTLTTIVTYTPTANKKITRIAVSGTAYGKVELFLNASILETKRMGPDRSVEFNFSSPLSLLTGIPLDVKITHYATSELNNFESTIYGA